MVGVEWEYVASWRRHDRLSEVKDTSHSKAPFPDMLTTLGQQPLLVYRAHRIDLHNESVIE